MIGYVLVGTNDPAKATAFYDALFATIGIGKLFDRSSGGRVYGISMDKPFFGVVAPYDGLPATIGNGTMVSLVMDSRNQVDIMHARAIELGGANEGAPGVRGGEGANTFYAAYFRDLDGNKLCMFRLGTA